MKITDKTIQFIDGQCVTTHTVFEDEHGIQHVHEPGATQQKWHRLEDYSRGKTVHDPAAFYANVHRRGGLSPHGQLAEAAARKAEAVRGQQRTVNPKPLVVVDPESGKFKPNEPK